MEQQSSCSLQFRNPQIKTASALNVANRCCCQTIGCPLPIIVKAPPLRQGPSVPRMYPHFGKAVIQPIDAKENGAGISPYNSHTFQHLRVVNSATGNPLSKKNLNSSSHLQSHKPVLEQMLNRNSKDEMSPYHPKLTVTCKAPSNWLRMKWGRV